MLTTYVYSLTSNVYSGLPLQHRATYGEQNESATPNV